MRIRYFTNKFRVNLQSSIKTEFYETGILLISRYDNV